MHGQIVIDFDTNDEEVAKSLYDIINSIAPFMVDNVTLDATLED